MDRWRPQCRGHGRTRRPRRRAPGGSIRLAQFARPGRRRAASCSPTCATTRATLEGHGAVGRGRPARPLPDDSSARRSPSTTAPRSRPRATASTSCSRRSARRSLCGLAIVAAAGDPMRSRRRDARPAIPVGVGIHAGETVETPDGYVGTAGQHRGPDLRARQARRGPRQRHRPGADPGRPRRCHLRAARPTEAQGRDRPGRRLRRGRERPTPGLRPERSTACASSADWLAVGGVVGALAVDRRAGARRAGSDPTTAGLPPGRGRSAPTCRCSGQRRSVRGSRSSTRSGWRSTTRTPSGGVGGSPARPLDDRVTTTAVRSRGGQDPVKGSRTSPR